MSGPLRRVDGDTWRQPGRMSCTACGYSTDAFGHHEQKPADPRAPQTGDWSICLRCGEVSVIDLHPLLGASLRPATTAELAEFAANPANIDAVRRVHQFNAGAPGTR